MAKRNASCCIMDNGLFVDLAVRLAKDFAKVWYCSPWEDAFPRSNSMLIGKGLPGVTRIDEIWSILNEVDLFVFPDVYYGRLQLYLQSIGKRVWGSRMGEELELDRAASKKHMKSLGIGIGNYEVVKGLDALREYLKEHDDVYVKISKTRGDVETFHSPSFKLVEPELDRLESVLGAKQRQMQFICEDSLPEHIEIAVDWYTIDGELPAEGMVGIEAKNKSYVGAWESRDEILPELLEPYERLAPTLQKYHYRNWLALETFITKEEQAFVVDPCCRFGSPPGELCQVMYANLSDILWEGAAGTMVDPEPAGKYGVQLMIQSDWADRNWLPVQFPEDIADYVMLKNATRIGGQYYVVPQTHSPEDPPRKDVGAICAVGDTIEEAVEKVKEYAEQVEGYYLDIHADSLDHIQDEIERLKEWGIDL